MVFYSGLGGVILGVSFSFMDPDNRLVFDIGKHYLNLEHISPLWILTIGLYHSTDANIIYSQACIKFFPPPGGGDKSKAYIEHISAVWNPLID